MTEAFIAMLFIFEAATGQLVSQGLAVFESESQCEAMIVDLKNAAPFEITVEGKCIAAPYHEAE